MRSSTRRKRERERESDDVVFRSWSVWHGGVLVYTKLKALRCRRPHSVRDSNDWWISKEVSVCALLLVKEWKVKRHHIYLKMRLISAGPSFPHTVWWGSNVGGCADLHAIPRRNVSFVSSKRENKRSFEWNDLNRREKVPKQQASAEKMQQRFCALHHSRPNDLDGDERKGT